jgi:hypothetical protein
MSGSRFEVEVRARRPGSEDGEQRETIERRMMEREP